MSGAMFDTPRTARDLAEASFPTVRAEALAAAMRARYPKAP